jgi:hypothetical protein
MSFMNTPVVFLIFNRPETTRKVFAEIAKAKPSKLLVVADGSRPNCFGEAEKCAETRSIIERVDWDCEVLTNYSEVNLGCKSRIASGLDWVFSIVEEAIILEDDCLPNETFFRFCEELLKRYRDDERIMSISGTNQRFDKLRTQDSYYFSRYNHIWGWATWRRAWQYYDSQMRLWPRIKEEGWLKDIFKEPRLVKFWEKNFESAYAETWNTWDWQWLFACWVQSGLSILPRVNLISNIGFGENATTTMDINSKLAQAAKLPVRPMDFPLQHPSFVIRDAQEDNRISQLIARIKSKSKLTAEL